MKLILALPAILYWRPSVRWCQNTTLRLQLIFIICNPFTACLYKCQQYKQKSYHSNYTLTSPPFGGLMKYRPFAAFFKLVIVSSLHNDLYVMQIERKYTSSPVYDVKVSVHANFKFALEACCAKENNFKCK